MIYCRKLSRADLARIEAHFLGLSVEDRRRRFHSGASDEAIRAYCRGFRWSERAVIGAFAWGRLVGLAESVRVAPERVEIAVSVEASWQRHGVGRELVRRALSSAANRGVTEAVLDYVPGERSIPNIARSLGGDIDAGGAVAHIKLPAHSARLEIEEFVEDIAAAAAWAFDAAFWPLRLAAGAV